MELPTFGFLYLEPIDMKPIKNESVIAQVRRRPPLGWREQFLKWDKILTRISGDLEDQKYYPPPGQEFRAFHLTPLARVRVVIIGQDPYAEEGQAMGMSFSVPFGVKVPPSLRNIYKELSTDISNFKIPDHGDLTYWAVQGVFLLNKDLTVPPNNYNGHSGWWESFLKDVIIALRKARPKTIFLLWGRSAQSLADDITAKKRILTASHPSPKSADRGFFGCKHFSKVNEMLVTDKETPIDWHL